MFIYDVRMARQMDTKWPIVLCSVLVNLAAYVLAERIICTESRYKSKIDVKNRTSRCILPPQPQHGIYQVISELSAEPSEALDSVILNVTCISGYNRSGKNLIHCVYGHWSDKMPECARVTPAQLLNSENQSERLDQLHKCVLPPQPEHGSYVIIYTSDMSNGSSGQASQLVINITCYQGYFVIGSNVIYCFNNLWSEDMPKCERMCQLRPHPSVEYRCQLHELIKDTRVCNEYEPSGTVVFPRCQTPNYRAVTVLSKMHCFNGTWNYIAKCTPECGRVTPPSTVLVIGGAGFAGKRGKLPWHAGIYKKTSDPYMQICGGSIISNRVVISAAHCFWNNANKTQYPPYNYAVAVGKIFRPWNNAMEDGQKSDVKDVKIPIRFQGDAASLQDDIALVTVITQFIYSINVRPVCIYFDIDFERHQLQPGKIGKVAGWGLTAENGNASPVLMVTDLPYISIDQCIAEYSPGFSKYITSDKICAGYTNGSALCKGDSGGGLAFPATERGTERYYLHGVASAAPSNGNLCNIYTYTSFTQLMKHEHFIKPFLTD